MLAWSCRLRFAESKLETVRIYWFLIIVGLTSCGAAAPYRCQKDEDCNLGYNCYRNDCVMRCDNGLCPIFERSCIPYDNILICDEYCTQADCSTREECIGFSCREVDCGFYVPCQNADEICDPWTHRCLPHTGDCAIHGCPEFIPIQQIASITCKEPEQLCRAEIRPIRVDDLSSSDIPIVSPEPGQLISTVQALTFRWQATNDS